MSKYEARTYHSLPRSVRDHLLACAQLQSDELPHVQNINHRVMELRGGARPSDKTSYEARDRLVDNGWIEEIEQENAWNGYQLTQAGLAVLHEAHQEFEIGMLNATNAGVGE